MRTYPNQKIISIVKEPSNKKKNYGIFNNAALEYAASQLGATDFKLYIYLAKNQDRFEMALSKKAFMEWANCQENTYREAVKSLINKGFIIQEGTKYVFYEKPIADIKEEKVEEEVIEN